MQEDLHELPGLDPDPEGNETFLLCGVNQYSYRMFANCPPLKTKPVSLVVLCVNICLQALNNFWWKLVAQDMESGKDMDLPAPMTLGYPPAM